MNPQRSHSPSQWIMIIVWIVFYHHSSPDYIQAHKLKYPPFLLQTVSNEVHWEIMRGGKFPPFQNKFAPQYILWNRQGWKCQDKGWNNLHTYTLTFSFSDHLFSVKIYQTQQSPLDSKVNPCCEILPKYFWQKRKEGAASQQVNTKLLTTQMWRVRQTYSENFVEN